MKITFLGTGTSQGVPIICCKCEVCTSSDPKDNRLRSSVKIEMEHVTFIIDSGPDFRYQMIRSKTDDIDAIVFTHSHKDHIAGLDDIRSYNYCHNKEIDIYANAHTIASLKREFDYIFSENKYPGVPEINLQEIKNEPFFLKNNEIIPISLLHYKMEVYGYRIGDFTYITDANYIAEEEKEKIKGSKILVLNALRREPHISHFSLDEAIALAQEINAEQTYFTHISHQLGLHQEVEKELPPNIFLAYDELVLEL